MMKKIVIFILALVVSSTAFALGTRSYDTAVVKPDEDGAALMGFCVVVQRDPETYAATDETFIRYTINRLAGNEVLNSETRDVPWTDPAMTAGFKADIKAIGTKILNHATSEGLPSGTDTDDIP